MSTGTDHFTDRQLIDAALAGAAYGFEELVHRYQDRLIGALRSLVRCPDVADDIAQDAFAKAFFHLASYKRHSQFYTWLFRIAMNSRSNYFRRSHDDLPLGESGEPPGRTRCDKRDTPDEFALRNEACEQVREAMQSLDDAHRRILVLREFEGRDYNDIATVLGIQTGTVRSRLSRARAALRQRLTRSSILVVESDE